MFRLIFRAIFRLVFRVVCMYNCWCFESYEISYYSKAAVRLQAWSGTEGSRKLRFPDFMTTAQDSGKVVSLTNRPPLPLEIHLVLISVRGLVDPRAIVRPEGLCHRKIPMRIAVVFKNKNKGN